MKYCFCLIEEDGEDIGKIHHIYPIFMFKN